VASSIASRAYREPVLLERHSFLLRSFARQGEKIIRALRPEIVVTPDTPVLAMLRADVPLILWSDTVFGAMVGYYPQWSHLSRGTVQRGDACESAALRNAAANVFLSEWAADAATRLYGSPACCTHVIPFGGVMPNAPTETEFLAHLERRMRGPIWILWCGREWVRKGGDVAAEAVAMLRCEGIDARLRIVGMDPPPEVSRHEWVESIGLLEHNEPNGRHQVTDVMLRSDVHVLPTRAECMGLALAEASACGLPSVATRTGGTPSVVRDTLTGRLVDAKSGARGVAKAIGDIISSRPTYEEYCKNAFRDYEQRLSSRAVGAAFASLLARVSA
jgi:glycosyltransferase involved in cell wall biosynthesis